VLGTAYGIASGHSGGHEEKTLIRLSQRLDLRATMTPKNRTDLISDPRQVINFLTNSSGTAAASLRPQPKSPNETSNLSALKEQNGVGADQASYSQGGEAYQRPCKQTPM